MNKFKKATKRITAVAASAVLVSSAVFGSLANYPSNFVEDGKFNGKVVVGSGVGADDMTAAQAVIENLKSEFAGDSEKVTITYRGSSSGGEEVLIADAGNVLKLGESLNTVKSTAFDDRDLDLLADGTLRVGTSNVDYTQEIKLKQGSFEHSFRDRLESSMSQKLFFERNQDIMTYTVDFKTDINNADFTVENLQGKKITFLGNEYTIADVKNSTYEMKLLGGANTISLGEGESTTVTVGGKTYTVAVQSVATGKALLSVNGQTMSIDEFETDIVGGVRVVVTDLVPSSRDSVKGYAEIVVGGSEILLKNGNEVELNDEKISKEITDYYVKVDFNGDLSSMTFTYRWLGSDGIILRAGEIFEDKLFNSFGVKFDGVNNVEYEDTVISATRDTLSLETELIDGTTFNRDIAFAEEFDVSPGVTNAVLRTIGTSRDVPMLFDTVDFGTGVALSAEIGTETVNEDKLFTVTVNTNMIFAGNARDIDRLFETDATSMADLVNGTTQVLGFKSNYIDNGLTLLAAQDLNTQYLYSFTGYNRDSNVIADDEYTILDQANKGASSQRYGVASTAASPVASTSIAGKLTQVDTFTAVRNSTTSESYVTEIDFNGEDRLALAGEGLLNISGLTTGNLSTPVTFSFAYEFNDLRLDSTGDDGVFDFEVSWDSSDDTIEVRYVQASSPKGVITTLPSGARDYVSDSNRDVKQVVDKYGTIVEYDSDKRDRVTISVPDKQVEARAYLVAGDVSSSTQSVTVNADQAEAKIAELQDDGYTIVDQVTSSTEAVEFDVTGPVLDTQASVEDAIVVGGPAVNAAARELLGIDVYTNAQAGVNPGEGVIRYFENTNSVLVYGYTKADTVAAVSELNAGGLSGNTVNVQ